MIIKNKLREYKDVVAQLAAGKISIGEMQQVRDELSYPSDVWNAFRFEANICCS